MQELIERSQDLIADLNEVIEAPDESHYNYCRGTLALLPSIKGSLELIHGCLILSPPDTQRAYDLSKGFGRLTIEYADFDESELGIAAGDYYNDLVQWLKSQLSGSNLTEFN